MLGLPPYAEVRGGLAVIKSYFLHPAVFGWLTAFSSLLLLAIFACMRRWWSLPLAVAMNVGTVFSGRRTPIVAVLTGLIVAAVWTIPRQGGRRLVRTWLPILAATAMVVVLFLPVLEGFYRETLNEYGKSPNVVVQILSPEPDPAKLAGAAPRTALYVASLAIARDNLPFGAGLGRFGSYMSRVNYSPVYRTYGLDQIYGLRPDNRVAIDDTFWPSVLGETGVIGCLAFGVGLAALLHRLWKASRRAEDPAWRAATLGAVLVFIQGFIASLTAATYVAPPIAYFVFASAAAILTASGSNAAATGRPQNSARDRFTRALRAAGP